MGSRRDRKVTARLACAALSAGLAAGLGACTGGGADVPVRPATPNQEDPFVKIENQPVKSLDQIKEDSRRVAEELGLEGVEGDLAAMQSQFDQLYPGLRRLLLIEEDIRKLLVALADLPEDALGLPPGSDAGTLSVARDPAEPAPAIPVLPSPETATPEPATPPGPKASAPTQSPTPPVLEAAAEIAEPPVADPVPAPPASPLSKRPAVSLAKPAGTMATPGGEWGVHVGSYRVGDSARRELVLMRRDVSGSLAGLTPTLQPATGTPFVRLVLGPFGSRDTAATLCRRFKTIGRFCQVVRFGGTPLY